MTADRRSRLWWVILLLAPGVWLADLVVRPSSFPFLAGSSYTDLLISHWPTAWFIHDSLARLHQMPLWNPNILSGMPLAADPLAGIWYPPTWLCILSPTPLGFNAFLFAHLAWAGVGMAVFLRRNRCGRGAALFSGLAYGGLAKLVGHVGLGHVGMVAAASWLAWFLLVVGNAAGALDKRRARRLYLLAAVVFALMVLADPRWAVPAAALGFAWWLRCSLEARVRGVGLQAQLPSAAISGILSAMLCAPLLLPMRELVLLSTRSDLRPAETAVLSLPPIRLLSLVDPRVAGTPEWQAYVGLLVLFFAGAAILLRARGWVFWIAVATLSLLWSIGSYTPVYTVLSQIIPGALAVRVPSRLLFVMAFGLIVLAGMGLEALASGGGLQQARRPVRLWGFALMVLSLIVAGLAPSLLSQDSVRWMTLASALALGVILVGTRWSQRGAPWMAAGASALLVLDLAAFNLQQIEARPAAEALEEGEGRITRIESLIGPDLRAFSPSYSLPQQTSARLSLGLADGVHPLPLSAYWKFMAAATGFDPKGYSVTLPPFPSGDPSEDWGPRPDSNQLGLLSVGAIASAYPLEGLEPIAVEAGTYFYENPAARPRAWVEASGDPPEAWGPVDSWSWAPNSIAVTARGPGRVVVSELDYPGWTASVDGEPSTVETAHSILRSTTIDEGEHWVVFEFNPRSACLGLVVGLVGLLLFCILWWRT